ncbi:MAG: hypothetical protein ABWY06_19705 [Pseudomonas sp.]|uniref:hypothetical protein n=1 Tax=Pseudomonas sp. TaxID=306 RepID=UPI00339A8AFC
MTVWIVGALLIVMLSPLVWLVPSRRQQGQMNLRLAARRGGLAMQLSRQEWPHWLVPEPPNSCAQYHRPRRRDRQDSWCYWQQAPGQWVNRWREPCTDPLLIEQFATLPGDVYMIEAGPRMLALCWGERGDEAMLQRIAAVLKALA